MKQTSRVARGCIAAGLGGVCWGFSGTFAQYLFGRYAVTTLWLTCFRLLAAGGILVVLSLLRYPGELKRILRCPGDLALTAVYGVTGLTLCQYAYMTGISHSNAATTTVLQTLSIMFIMVISCLSSRRLPRWNEALSVLLALFGTFLLATGGKIGQLVLSPQALFWGLCAAGAVTVYTLLGKPLLAHWGRETVMGLAMLMGGVVLNLAARSWTIPVELPVKGWLIVLFITVVGTVVSFSLFMQGIRDAGPVRAGILNVTEPVSAAILAFFWLHTAFTTTDLIGFAAITATMFLLARPAGEGKKG